jgi:hypothetical protein
MMDREVSYESENGKVIENVMNGVKILKGNVGCDFFFWNLDFCSKKVDNGSEVNVCLSFEFRRKRLLFFFLLLCSVGGCAKFTLACCFTGSLYVGTRITSEARVL